MKNAAWIIPLICAVIMPFLTAGWQSVLACLLLGVVHVATEFLTKRQTATVAS